MYHFDKIRQPVAVIVPFDVPVGPAYGALPAQPALDELPRPGGERRLEERVKKAQ